MRGGLGWLTRASPDWAVLLGRYYLCHGALPRILRPRTLNEKVFRRVLFDRSAWIAAAADKYAVRDFVRERLGPDVLPELYCVVEAAETLARGLDFVRVDFYDTPAKLVFGEITATPGCGLSPYMPPSSDRHLGSLWKSHARPNPPRVGRLPAELPRAPGDDDASQLPRGPDVGGRR